MEQGKSLEYNMEDGSDKEKDSDSGGFLNDDTSTLNSYIREYRFENHRRYHAYGTSLYWGPNDEEANAQQDLAHHMYLLTLDGKLHLAPISNPQSILDLGTGTGIWAIDMADNYPGATIIGTDLSPIQPSYVPPNCSFEIEDFTEPWAFPENAFDFIHGRELFGTVKDWDEFFSNLFKHTKPGGYIEMVEHSVCPRSDENTIGPDHFYTLWGETVLEMGDRWNKSFRIWEELAERITRAGFINVTEFRYKWPMNGWPKENPHLKELGRWNQYRLYHGIEGYMLRLLTTAGGWTYEKAQIFLARMRTELKDHSSHAYLDVRVVYGQRPP